MSREQYRNALIKSPAGLDKGTQDAYIGNIKATFDNNRFQYSPIVSAQEQTALTTLPAAGANSFVAAPEKIMGVGGGRRRRGKKSMRGKRATRKNKRTRRR
jgi:hypothetical protein